MTRSSPPSVEECGDGDARARVPLAKRVTSIERDFLEPRDVARTTIVKSKLHALRRQVVAELLDVRADLSRLQVIAVNADHERRFGLFDHDAVLRDRIAQSWGAPLLNQKALALSLREASYEQHMRRMVHTLGDTRARALDLIARRFPAGTRIAPGVHGFLLWLQLPDALDGYAFYQRAMARDIVVMPGFAFSATGGFRDCIRLSLGHPWSSAMADALAALGDLADRMLAENARLTASGHGAADARKGPAPSA